MALTKLKFRGVTEGQFASRSEVSQLIHAGMVMGVPWDFGATPPTGFLKCDGSTVSRSTYSDLFLAVGTTYGSGDGSTTFAIPDFRGKFLRGHGGNSDSIGSDQGDLNKYESGHVWMAPHTGSGMEAGESDLYGLGAGRVPIQYNGTGYPDNYGGYHNYVYYVNFGSVSLDTDVSSNNGQYYGKGYNHINTYVGTNGTATSTSNITQNPEARPVNLAIHWVIKY